MSMKVKRILFSVLGVVISAMSVAVFKLAAFGVDPFQSLMSGLDKVIPIDFGTLYVIVNVILLAFGLCFNRHAIGLATIINLTLFGYIIEFTLARLQSVFPAPGVGFRLGCLAFAIVTICFGMSLYIAADMGVSTYDAVAITLSEKWKLGKFQYIRIISDVICVVLGVACFLAGGGSWDKVPTVAGFATIITAFFMGPLINFFKVRVAVPMLNR